MTDLSKYLIEDVYTTDDATCKSASKSRDDAQSLVSSLTDIDSKIRKSLRRAAPKLLHTLTPASVCRYRCTLG